MENRTVCDWIYSIVGSQTVQQGAAAAFREEWGKSRFIDDRYAGDKVFGLYTFTKELVELDAPLLFSRVALQTVH